MNSPELTPARPAHVSVKNLSKTFKDRKRGEVKAGVIEFEAPIHISNVMLVCPQCDQRTRAGFARQEDGRKVRVCKECGEAID